MRGTVTVVEEPLRMLCGAVLLRIMAGAEPLARRPHERKPCPDTLCRIA